MIQVLYLTIITPDVVWGNHNPRCSVGKFIYITRYYESLIFNTRIPQVQKEITGDTG
jgi:hypothetical protein